ncbi:MAG: hypothetical protein ACLQBX_05670 [Candidatus Limnocylindrales bacterium]
MTGSALSGTVYDAVEAKLNAADAPHAALDLWTEIERQFRDGGPDAVKSLLDRKARALSNAAARDLRATRAVATAIGPARRKTASPKAPARRPDPGRSR